MTSEFAQILKNPQIPLGTIKLVGALQYQKEPNRPALETASLWGMISSPELKIRSTTLQTTVRDFGAKYRLADGNAEIENLRAQLLGGRLQGRATVRDLAGAGKGTLEATLSDVSLNLLQTASKTNSLREAHLVGTVSANAEASWAKSLKNLVAHGNATIKAVLGQNPATPLDGMIHADYSAANQQLALHQSYIRTPETSINLNGKISRLSQLQFRIQARDLHELELLADNLRPATPGQTPQKLDLYGAASLNGSVSGTVARPQIKAQLTATDLRVKGSAWKRLRTNIGASPSQVALTNGELDAASQGRIKFNVQASLKHWAYSPSSPIVAQVSGSQMSVADLERLVNKSYPVTGTLALNVSLHGTQLNPVGRGNVTLANAVISSEPVQKVNLEFQGDGATLNAKLDLRMPAGNAQGQLTYHPGAETYQAQFQASNFRLEKLHTVAARNLQIAGGVNVNAGGRGSVKNPELLATVTIPQLQVQKQAIQGVKLQTHLQNHVADIALDSEVAQTYVKARGSLGVKAPYQANLRLDTGRIAFQPLLALYAPAQAADVSGQTELHASLRGPLQEKSRVEAHLEIPVLNASYKQLQLAAAKPIRIDYQNGVAVLQPTAIQGTGTSIRMQASVPVKNINAAKFLMQGTVDLQIAQLVYPDLQSTGQVQFDIDSRRYAAGSNLNGQVRIVNANLHTATSPVGLDHGNGVISVTRDRLEITSFQGQVGGGTITAKGGAAYLPRVQFNLALAAKGIRLRYPEGLRTVLDSNLALTGRTQASLLSGQVLVQHVSFTPEFDLTSFASQFGGGEVAAPSSSPFLQNMKLNIAVQSTSQMNLASSQVNIQGNANLRVAGTAAMPVVLGRTTLTGGELFLAGNRYVVQQGTIDFLNPVRTQPVVNLQIKTTVNQYNIALNIEGPVERLHTNYTSDPALPPVDIINLLAFGKTTEAAAQNPNPLGTLGAQSVLAQGVSSVVSSRVAKFAGLSHFSIDPALGGNGQDPGARIAIQQRVTSNLFVTYATDVTSTQRQAIQLEYQLNRRWSVDGVRDQNGGFGVTGHYKKDF